MQISAQAEQGIRKLEEYRAVLAHFMEQDPTGEKYSQPIERGYTLGEQVRHVLDYYGCLLRGFVEAGEAPYQDRKVGVDYINRERSLEVERSIRVAIERINITITAIRDLCSRVSDDLLLLHRNNAETDSWFTADMGTQLQINWVHAVHHAEIIMGVIQRFFPDFEFPENFAMDRATIQRSDSTA